MYDNLKNRVVLYIEDDEVVLENISKLLKNYFKIVHTASDGESAYEIFVKRSIDLLIVDIELPRLNGINFIKRVRKIDKDIPIVIISAYTKTDYLLESVELNLNKYIVKPFTSQKFHMLLKKLNETFKSNTTYQLTPDILINKNDSTIKFENQTYKLTPKELEFLEIISTKKVITYNEIDNLWHDKPPSADAIRSFIKTLRKKLPPNLLKNRQNFGYYIDYEA